MSSIFLNEWKTPFNLPPFDQISDDDFLDAFEEGVKEELAHVDAIASNPEPPTFANTIEAGFAKDTILDRVLSAFYAVNGADTNPKREEIARIFSPKLADLSSKIYSNKVLFQRIDTLYQTRDTLGLTKEQHRVLTLTHQNWIRAGASLTGDAEVRMKEIKQRLSILGTEFAQNVLADERSWYMELTEDDLVGLPEFLIRAASAAGKEKGVSGPIITTSRSLYVPFMQFSPRRDLRQHAQAAWEKRGAEKNLDLAAEMVNLRHEMALLLGYQNFSEYKLETEMAKTSDNVRKLLMDVWEPAKAQALADEKILTQMMQEDGINGPLEAWDWHYYAEKRRQADHDLDEGEIKSYFQLDRMIEAAFDCANRLFGLEFTPVDVTLYHPDCRAWDVTRDGKHVALFIGDYFARGSKRSGAWCSALQSQAKFPKECRPIVINVCNFAKDDPALLSADDARTLFHEFGHALHQMLSDVTYEMVSGTSVPRDFVELPSQLFEHWFMVPEVLQKYATHYQTGQSIPIDLMNRLIDASNFDMGFQTVEYVASALVDLSYHQGPLSTAISDAQTQILGDLGMPHAIKMRHATPHFQHVFSGGYYASAYYSYMWSEVMDADAFAAFEETGDPFNADRAKSLEANILSRGGSGDPVELYTQFRGRLPGVEALLKGRGLAA